MERTSISHAPGFRSADAACGAGFRRSLGAARRRWTSLLGLALALSAAGAESTAPGWPAGTHPIVGPGGKLILPGDLAAATNQAFANRAGAEAALKETLKVEQTGPGTFRIGRVEFDKRQGTISLPARLNIRTQVVEYVLVNETGKAYESMLTTEAKPTDVHLAALLLGLGPAAVGGGYNRATAVPASNAVSVVVSWQTNGATVKYSLPELIVLRDVLSEQPPRAFPPGAWLYNGSVFDSLGFVAAREGSLVSLIRDPACLLNNPRDDRDNHHVHFPNGKLLPPEGSAVRVTLQLPGYSAAPPPPAPPASPMLDPASPRK